MKEWIVKWISLEAAVDTKLKDATVNSAIEILTDGEINKTAAECSLKTIQFNNILLVWQAVQELCLCVCVQTEKCLRYLHGKNVL